MFLAHWLLFDAYFIKKTYDRTHLRRGASLDSPMEGHDNGPKLNALLTPNPFCLPNNPGPVATYVRPVITGQAPALALLT